MDSTPPRRKESSSVHLNIDGAPPEGWDHALPALPGSSFAHLSGWGPVMTQVLGHDFHFLSAVSDDGEILGGLPLVRMKSLLFGHVLVSVPFLNYGGPVGSPEVRTALAEEARTFARETGAKRLVLRSLLEDGAGLEQGREKVAVHLQLDEDMESFWKQEVPSKIRNQVRRPQKEGMTFELGSEHLGAFHVVFAENMRDLGTPVHGLGMFRALLSTFPEEALVGVVYHEGAPVAGGFGFLWNGEFEMTWASSLRRFNRLAPNMLLYWRFMEETSRRGGRIFNFGRSTPGTGTHRFKTQWGGEDVPLHWTEWTRGGAAEEDPGNETGAVGMASRVWQKLPLAVTNRVGPRLARLIPTF